MNLNNFLPYRLLVVTEQVSQAFAKRYKKEFDISIPESRILNMVGFLTSEVSSREICERTAMTKSRVSMAVNNLARSGLLVKVVDPNDQRLLQLSFTPKGRALYERMVPVALQMEEQLVAACGKRGREQLMALLAKVESSIELGDDADTTDSAED